MIGEAILWRKSQKTLHQESTSLGVETLVLGANQEPGETPVMSERLPHGEARERPWVGHSLQLPSSWAGSCGGRGALHLPLPQTR